VRERYGSRIVQPDAPRGRTGCTIGTVGELPGDDLVLSWALVLEGHDRGTTLHIRLRVAPSGHRWSRAIEVVGGLIDWLTIVALHRGLRERLNKENS
jgi:hypothetical protein